MGGLFRSYMACKLYYMGFKSTNTDPDVWCWTDDKSNGNEYYAYVLMNVDNLLVIIR